MKKLLLGLFVIFPILLIAQPVDVFQQFNGHYDFTAFGNTLNASPNPCFLQPSSTADLNLGPTETLLSAHLYWAGPWPSPNGGDLDVTLNGAPITASRTFSLTSGVGNNYFAAYADVTSIIAFNGNGTYTFADLDIDLAASNACSNGTDFAGWAVYVIYEDPALLLNQISLFDGLEFISGTNPSLDILLTNIEVSSDDFSKIGFLAWEGDAGIAVNETLIINGFLIDNPPLNPGDNAFNGTNSYTNSNTLYNMDLDFYNLENIIQPGDVTITINLTSSQDFVMVNNIITSVNSELPDATITIDNIGVFCENNNNLDIDYTVYNVNSTSPLPANTPIAFYVDNTLVGQSQTVNELPIGGSESGSINLTIPVGTPAIFTLKAVVDDDGTGNGIVSEADESNNEFEIIVDLNQEGLDLGPPIDSCEGYSVTLDADVGDPDFTYQWYFNGVIIPGATDPILVVTVSGNYFVEAIEGICYSSGEVDVLFHPNPIAVEPDLLIACDDLPNDGFAEFDLTVRSAQIQNGQPNTFVEFYVTEAGAEAGVFPIPTPTAYTNIVEGFQVIFARLEEITVGCYDVVPMEIQVDDSPALTDPITDYVLCDNDGDGVEIFDLRSKDVEILNFLINVTLGYFETQGDAQANINQIVNDTAYPNISDPQQIWVRGENTSSCVTVSSFLLVLDEVPIYVEPTPFEVCDDEVADGFTEFDLNEKNAEISDGDISLSITYYAAQGDAEAAVNPLPIPYTNTVNPEIIWVRIESNITGCYAVTTMELVVVEAPEIFPPDPLVYCDDDNDGFGEFILSEADDQVTGGNPGGNLVVSYHFTPADAQNGDLPITDVPYLNVVPFLQTVYVRVFDLSTGCYNTTTLDLVVVDSPPIADPLPIVLCDDDGDGIEIFDLTIREVDILDGLDPADYTITYYEDASLTIAIGNPTTYPNITNPQTIYVVVEDNGNGCQSVTTLLLEVHLPPVLVGPTPLELCDVNNPGDEMEAFDLESRTFEITGGNANVVITYHETQADADAGINALLSPYVNILDNPQTIFVRAEDSNTSCVVSDQVTLDLIVNPLPSPVTPTPLEVCDADNDGFAEFDLASKDAEIIGGEPGVAVTYYETLIDAENGVFALSSPYINIQTPTQTVYVRAEYPPIIGGSGCFRVVELLLVVLPSPEVPLDLEPLTLCDDDGDGFGVFDLTERSPDIYGGQDPADYTLSYYENFFDANDGVNAIGTPTMYTNTSNPQTIFVRLEDNVSLCYSLGQFELQVSLGPVLTQPTAYTLCDDLGEENDGFTVFDLTTKNDEITGGDPNLDVKYYETQGDADNDTNVIDPDTAYTNIDNPQTLYIRVTDGNTECYDTTITLTLRVESNPTPGEADDLELCDDNDPGDEIEVFDLTQVEPQVIGISDWDVSYHETYQDAFDNINAIATPGAYSNITNPQTIYVRVTNNNTPEGCFEIVDFDLIVHPLPDDTAAIEDMIQCEIGSDGVGIFDLTTKIDEALGGQDPAIFQVSFFETDVDAQAGVNAIVNPGDYQSDGSVSPPGQAIWVGILNLDTGCYVGGVQHFYLLVLEGAEATEPSFPYAICDNLGANDGIGEFDFILFDNNIHGIDIRAEILGGQDPAIYLISFHETAEDADANVNPLPDLYVNLINPQVIFVRVTNGDTDCYDVTELILKVEELPIVNLEDQYRLCVDANGDPLPSEEGEPSPPIIDTGLDPSRYSFVWELDGQVIVGEIFPFITATQGGEYTVTVTEIETGCEATATTTVVVSSPPLTYSAEVVSGPFGIDEVIHTGPGGVTTTYVDTHVIHVEADGLGEYVYQLDDGPFQEEDIFVDVLPGVHIITIKDIYGCGSVTIEVVVIDYPRYVTPNHDGYHDTWNIIGMGYQDPSAKIYIFDRFGKLIKQLSPMGEGWDGTYNGNPMPSSDYWFRVEYTTDNQTSKLFKGHFTLKR